LTASREPSPGTPAKIADGRAGADIR
jgi:hypothetical protein